QIILSLDGMISRKIKLFLYNAQHMNKPINEQEQPAERTPESTEETNQTSPEATQSPEKEKSTLTPIPKAKKDIQLRDLRRRVPIGPGNFWNNMLSTVLLLIFITAVFSYITETRTEPDALTLSQVAEQVKAGEVDTIIVRGDTLEISYKDETRN